MKWSGLLGGGVECWQLTDDGVRVDNAFPRIPMQMRPIAA